MCLESETDLCKELREVLEQEPFDIDIIESIEDSDEFSYESIDVGDDDNGILRKNRTHADYPV